MGRGVLSEDRDALVNHYERGGVAGSRGPPSSVYHMGTLGSRVNKLVQDPGQVVDSAYGTTRSNKKVYL